MTEGDSVPLREYVEALFEQEKRRSDREADEREKAAQALAITLAGQIKQGDEALRDHIDQQIQQIQQMLEAHRSEQAVRDEASQRAIDKAETLNKERWEASNEWRGQSADRERSQQEQMTNLSSTFLPREVAEAQLHDLRRTTDAHYTELRQRLAELAEKVAKIV